MNSSPPRPILTKPCLSILVLAALGLGLAARTTSAQVITWGPGCDHLRLSPIQPASAWLPLE